MHAAPIILLGLSMGCVAPHAHAVGDSSPHAVNATHDRHGLPALRPIPGRRISHDERWSITMERPRKELEGTQFGEQEIEEFWKRKGWRLTQREERYFDEVRALEQQGLVTQITAWSTCPFTVVYQTLDQVRILDTIIPRGHEFILELDDDDDHLKVAEPRFSRTAAYSDDHEEGHGPAAER